MAKLIFLFVLAALVLVASAARIASSDYDKEGLAKNRTILDAATLVKNGTVFPSHGNYTFGDSKELIQAWKCNRQDWKECMLGVLQYQFKSSPCNGHCNVFIWRFTYDGDSTFMKLSSHSKMPSPIFQETKLYIQNGFFRCYMFHGPAYFETAGGWYGFANWGFIGAYSHVTNTNRVTFWAN